MLVLLFLLFVITNNNTNPEKEVCEVGKVRYLLDLNLYLWTNLSFLLIFAIQEAIDCYSWFWSEIRGKKHSFSLIYA